MLHDPQLLDALEACVVPSGWDASVWRRAFTDREPLSPNSRGARWNPAGVDALYCALTPEGAEIEHESMLKRQPIPPSKPRHTVEIRTVIASVADLRAPEALKPAGLGPDDLTQEAWEATRRVGAAAAWLGMGALVVPSARHPDGNIVIFVNNLMPGDIVEVAE